MDKLGQVFVLVLLWYNAEQHVGQCIVLQFIDMDKTLILLHSNDVSSLKTLCHCFPSHPLFPRLCSSILTRWQI